MISPTKVVTDNVLEEILHVAREESVNESTLRIELNSVTTWVKTSTKDFTEIPQESVDTYKDEKFLRDDTLEFKQQYNIKIRSKRSDYPFKYMHSQVEFEQNDTFAYLVIKQGSRLQYHKKLYEDFLEYITEQKLRANIMLYLFDVDYESTIKEFVTIIEKMKLFVFKEDKKILISKGVDSIEGVKSQLIMNIEEKSNVGVEDSMGKVDHSNRGLFINCTQGEQLFEFIKPQQGQYGRSCRGEIIDTKTINLDETPTFTVDDSIEIQDSFENIKYIATKSGFLLKEGNRYDVSNNLDIGEISFKTTGAINSNLDADITINVKKNDPLEDAIEEGMHVKVKKLFVIGNIGPDTKIETREISVNGQTHDRTFIQCVNADIKQHRGKVIGREVKIHTLEGGVVVADRAIIEHAVRGKIRAKVIEIGSLGSNVVMEASKNIQVDIINGGENKFIIDPSITSAFDNIKKPDINYVQKLEGELKLLSNALKDITEKVKKNLEPCKKIQDAIVKKKKEGADIPDSLVKNFKICKVMMVRYKKLKEDFKYKKSQLEKVQNGQLESNLDIFDAKIVVKKPIEGFNTIVYRLANPNREIVLKTDKRMNKTTFKLREEYDGSLRIVNIN
jgi:hypothetical protein